MKITIEDLNDLKAYLSGIRNDLNCALERLEMIEDIMEKVEDESDMEDEVMENENDD